MDWIAIGAIGEFVGGPAGEGGLCAPFADVD